MRDSGDQTKRELLERCPVCGGDQFRSTKILWPELVQAWELSEEESNYIDRQQGLSCAGCGNNLRAMALASAMLRTYGIDGTLREATEHPRTKELRVLELNPAGGLTATLERFSHHRLVTYPEFDLCDLDLPSAAFDLVLHSDTLEHVEDPDLALKECRRVLKPDGFCIFTVPVVVGRMSRSRRDLPPSYHGQPGCTDHDLLVRTEFGADMWAYILRAGFASCIVHSLEYPAGLALVAES